MTSLPCECSSANDAARQLLLVGLAIACEQKQIVIHQNSSNCFFDSSGPIGNANSEIGGDGTAKLGSQTTSHYMYTRTCITVTVHESSGCENSVTFGQKTQFDRYTANGASK